VKILIGCASLSNKLEAANQAFVQSKIPDGPAGSSEVQNIALSHHGIALAAMHAIWRYPWAKHAEPSTEDILRIVNNAGILDDPFMDADQDPRSLLIRLAYAQFPLQESSGALISRWLALLTEVTVQGDSFDASTEFEELTGLSIKEFIAIGFAFLTQAWSLALFTIESIQNTKISPLSLSATPEKVALFLKLTSINFATFRDLCNSEVKQYGDLGPYNFNPPNSESDNGAA
jgi:hypothetical protein